MSIRTTRRGLLAGAGAVGALAATSSAAHAAPAPPRVHVAGDSTASTYATALKPRAGWGQALQIFLTGGFSVKNAALSGASSKSFADAGLLDAILATMVARDLLLISFGHNDEKDDPARHTDPATTFKTYLSRYIDGARAKGGVPVLVTPVERRRFDSAGHATVSHGAYPAAMRELAAARSVPLIDLTALSLALWESLGVEGTKEHFLWLAAGESANYPDGIEDNTHFQAHGAIEVARLVATAMHHLAVLPPPSFRRLTTANLADSLVVWPA